MEDLDKMPIDIECKKALNIYLNNKGIKVLKPVQKELLQLLFKPEYAGNEAFDRVSFYVKSKTASGKTYAFLLPLLAQVKKFAKEKDLQAVILTPTEELAVQIYKDAKELFAIDDDIKGKLELINGSGNLKRQIEALKKKPSLIVGTPGRIYELISMKKIKVHTCKTIVLDEADKLANKAYKESVLKVRKSCLKDTATWMFSATLSNKSKAFAEELASKLEYIDLSEESKMPTSIKHLYLLTELKTHTEQIRKVISAYKDKKWIIFADSALDCEEIYQKLKFHKYKVLRLYGRLDKDERAKSMRLFKDANSGFNVLICTDIAARGIHIDGVFGIINNSLPESIDEYVHRAGRCGRNDSNGLSISLVSDKEKVKAWEKDLGVSFKAYQRLKNKNTNKGKNKANKKKKDL